MNETVSLDQLPPQVESLLRAVWEGNESLVLEQDGKPVAVVVPMDEYRKWHTAEGENPSRLRTSYRPTYRLSQVAR